MARSNGVDKARELWALLLGRGTISPLTPRFMLLLFFLSLNEGEKEKADFLSFSLLGAFVPGEQEDETGRSHKADKECLVDVFDSAQGCCGSG